MVRPAARGAGIPPRPACAGPHFRCATGFRPPSDSRARWTPWSVFQDGSGGGTGVAADPLRLGTFCDVGRSPPWRRGAASGRAEDSPPRSAVAPGARGPRPRGGGRCRFAAGPRGWRGERKSLSHGPGKRRSRGERGAVNTRGRVGAGGGVARAPRSHLRRRSPSKPTRSRSRRSAAGEVHPAGGGRPTGGGAPRPLLSPNPDPRHRRRGGGGRGVERESERARASSDRAGAAAPYPQS